MRIIGVIVAGIVIGLLGKLVAPGDRHRLHRDGLKHRSSSMTMASRRHV